MSDALGLLEVWGLTPSMAALDAMEKSAGVEVLQAEINDLLGVCMKLSGPVGAVRTAIAEGRRVAEQMGATVTGEVLARVDDRAMQAILSPPEFNPLIQQDVVFNPRSSGPSNAARAKKGAAVDHDSGLALGFIETQGFTAVFAAIDRACKAANVEIVGKEKLGGGFVTVVIRGDVASVRAAIEAGQAEVESLGKLIAAHVIPRPSPSVISLLPAVASLR
ncbi:MAG: BMC domain-containing protein [Isosphaeraceae bacterium]